MTLDESGVSKVNRLILLVAVLALLALLVACTSSPSITKTPSLTHETTTAPPSSTSGTFGDLAQSGQTVYASRCAGCHGNNGQGSSARALWGANADLSRYNSAAGLLSFIGSYMPSNAPGSLVSHDYIDVMCYLLIQNYDVSAGANFVQSQLSSIALK